jgi:uncharacterized protein (DUF927 family)
LADELKRAASNAYGTAGPAFVARLIFEGLESVAGLIRDMVDIFVMEHVPDTADPQVKRAAAHLALIGAAGELATEWEITPWQPGDAFDAARTALHDWTKQRGGYDGAEVRNSIAEVRTFLQTYGESAFEPVEPDPSISEQLASDGPFMKRSGWRKGSGPSRQWYMLPEAYKALCAGNPTETARALARQGMLVPDEKGGKFSRSERTPAGTRRVYVLNAVILEEPHDD